MARSSHIASATIVGVGKLVGGHGRKPRDSIQPYDGVFGTLLS